MLLALTIAGPVAFVASRALADVDLSPQDRGFLFLLVAGAVSLLISVLLVRRLPVAAALLLSVGLLMASALSFAKTFKPVENAASMNASKKQRKAAAIAVGRTVILACMTTGAAAGCVLSIAEAKLR